MRTQKTPDITNNGRKQGWVQPSEHEQKWRHAVQHVSRAKIGAQKTALGCIRTIVFHDDPHSDGAQRISPVLLGNFPRVAGFG